MVPLHLAGVLGSWGYGFGGPWHLRGGIGMILLGSIVPIAILILAVFLFRRFYRGGKGNAKPTAMEELKRRYARGEISKEDFLDMKKTLRED